MCMYGNYYYGGEPSKEYKEMMKAVEIENKTERKKSREAKRAILSVGSLPNDFTEWVDTLFDKVMFYTKIKRGKYTARCEVCQVTVELPHARSSRKIECPSCGNKVILKDANKFPGCHHQTKCLTVLDTSLNGWTQRIFVCDRHTTFNMTEVYSTDYIQEEQRDHFGADGKVRPFHPVPYNAEAYKARWDKGDGRVHGQGWKGWRAENMPLHTYPHNLKEIFRNSQYQYSALEIASEKSFVNPFWYLQNYGKEPKLELLYKVGLYRLAEELISSQWYDFDAKRLLRSAKSLKDLGIDRKEEIEECRYFGAELLIARKEVKTWKIEEAVRPSAWAFVKKLNARGGTDFHYSFISRERWFKYYLTQTDDYKEIGNFISDYSDYISDCCTLGVNLKDTAVNRPKSLKVSHDWARDEIKIQETQVYDALIEATYDSLSRFAEWSDGKFTVIMPRTSKEIVEEGVRQSHCVGRYCERVAVGESIVLFLRRADDPSKNFFTMEIKKDMANLDVVQCRGYGNAEKTEEVEKFLKKYERWFNHRPLDGYDAGSVMVHYFKAVHKKDGRYISDRDKKMEFRIGEWKEEEEIDRDPDKVAVKGLHVASLEFAQNFGKWWDDVAILEVETNIHDVVVPDAKDQVRTSKFKVLREVPFEEMGEWGAQRLARAAEKAA